MLKYGELFYHLLGLFLVGEQKQKTKGQSFSFADCVNDPENVDQCQQFFLPHGPRGDDVLQVRDHPDDHLQLRRHEHG